MLAEVREQLAVLSEALVKPCTVVCVELIHVLSRNAICVTHDAKRTPVDPSGKCRSISPEASAPVTRAARGLVTQCPISVCR